MPNNATITHDQLRTLFLDTELGGNTQDLNRFTYAQKGNSTYTFGLLQFDIGKNGREVKGFLKENGFTPDDIMKLSQHGGLSHTELKALDAKLQAIPKDRIDQFTNAQLDKSIAGVSDVIDRVREQSPAAADAIGKDPKLQLGIADYENQYGPAGPQFVGFLAGNPEKLFGGTVQASNPPTREDLQKFIDATEYGHDKTNAAAVESRLERFDEAMATLKLGHAAETVNHTTGKTTSDLKEGSHGSDVATLQADLARLGYGHDRYHPLRVDGAFGIQTRHAVERFQHDHHITVDGKVGPLTQRALHTAVQQHVTAHGLGDPQNPDHALFEQALAGVRTLDKHGQPTEQQRRDLAAALTVEAKREGLTRIDQVALSEDASRTIAIQLPTSPTEIVPRYAGVVTMTGLQTPLAESAARAAAVPPPAEPVAQIHIQPRTQTPSLFL